MEDGFEHESTRKPTTHCLPYCSGRQLVPVFQTVYSPSTLADTMSTISRKALELQAKWTSIHVPALPRTRRERMAASSQLRYPATGMQAPMIISLPITNMCATASFHTQLLLRSAHHIPQTKRSASRSSLCTADDRASCCCQRRVRQRGIPFSKVHRHRQVNQLIN